LVQQVKEQAEEKAGENRQSRATAILSLVRKYPIPSFALSSLIVGSILHYALGLEQAANWLWIGTLVIGGIPVVYETVRGMLRRQFASDIVAMLAILVALILNDAFPGVIIVLMQTGGRALEDYAYRRASSSLDELLARSPRIAHVRRGESIEDVNVSDVTVGDTLVVRPGDLVAVDGVVGPDQVAQIDESSLTGEPLPKARPSGVKIYSGTVNAGGAFEMIASAKSGESQYAKIVELVRKAQQEKAPIQRLADRYAAWFTPITIAVAILGWAITESLETILAVLVVATPCSLIFATPVAIISGINKAARKGIVVKHGAAIEQIGKVKAMVFDKTGTITYGTPTIEQIICLDGTTEDELLFKAASMEQLSSHPVAQVVAAKGRQRFGNLMMPADFKEIPGSGVEGSLDGEYVYVGSGAAKNLASHNELETIRQSIKNESGKMIAIVAVNGNPKGAIILGDRLRQGVVPMLSELAGAGVAQTIMLTGDSHDNAKAIAEQAGLSQFKAELVPQEKVAAVRDLKEQYGSIAMVGDGINDAPALASATVGVAMGAKGTAISAEAADIVLLVDEITKVSEAFKIGSRTISIAKQSIFVGLGASVMLMIIASFGIIPPAVGAVLQEALDVAVILNALRAR
jgi:heavy metal translocating P-type ATPase